MRTWALLLCLLAFSADAGTLRVRNVWYQTQPYASGNDGEVVMVGSSAKYDGTPDTNDDNWMISSDLRVSTGATYYGAGQNGSYVPREGEVVTCDPTWCGGSGDVDSCDPWSNSTTYYGVGKVAIYHQYSPEIHSSNGATQSMNCDPPPPEDDGDIQGDMTTPCDCSPIVVDLDRQGLRFSSAEDGVLFDLDRDDELERTAWLAAGTGDGLLVLDRNGDGLINNGGELFGDSTDQLASVTPNGYAALALFDLPERGGNTDGRISGTDAIFASLRLWVDENHDAISQPWELHRLASLGVEAIDLDYSESRSRDRFGNELRYWSRVDLARGTTRSVDVFFVTEQ